MYYKKAMSNTGQTKATTIISQWQKSFWLSVHAQETFIYCGRSIGLGGRKPARQFTAIERGRVKFKYCRRKVVWDIIDRMVRGGFTAQVAIDKLYVVYGHITVTQIINLMRTDAIGGGHPELR